MKKAIILLFILHNYINYILIRWIEACIAEEIDPVVLLEESLRNGIVLAKLAKSFEPSVVRKIFTVFTLYQYICMHVCVAFYNKF